jgi:hypothetical protein
MIVVRKVRRIPFSTALNSLLIGVFIRVIHPVCPIITNIINFRRVQFFLPLMYSELRTLNARYFTC